MQTNQILGNDSEGFVKLVDKFVNVVSYDINTPKVALMAISDAIATLTAEVSEFKKRADNGEAVDVNDLSRLCNAKAALRAFETRISETLEEERRTINDLLTEIDKI